jgi:hypothetical protein
MTFPPAGDSSALAAAKPALTSDPIDLAVDRFQIAGYELACGTPTVLAWSCAGLNAAAGQHSASGLPLQDRVLLEARLNLGNARMPGAVRVSADGCIWPRSSTLSTLAAVWDMPGRSTSPTTRRAVRAYSQCCQLASNIVPSRKCPEPHVTARLSRVQQARKCQRRHGATPSCGNSQSALAGTSRSRCSLCFKPSEP